MPSSLARTEPVVMTGYHMDHLRGCPVPVFPENEALAARVETYRVQKNGLRLNFDGNRLETPWVTVVHCCECGALNYIEER